MPDGDRSDLYLKGMGDLDHGFPADDPSDAISQHCFVHRPHLLAQHQAGLDQASGLPLPEDYMGRLVPFLYL